MNREDQIRLATLLSRYIQGNATATEQTELFAHAANNPELRTFLQQYQNGQEVEADFDFLSNINHEAEWELFQERIDASKRKPFSGVGRWTWGIAAASVLLIVGFFITRSSYESQDGIIPDTQYGYKNDVLPGKNQAILTLSNGKQVTLEEVDTLLLTAGNTLKIESGSIDYRATTAVQSQQMNTIRTPKRGTYQVVLGDGTKVWLNAETELSFPVHFSGEQRHVELRKGEAFFEVAEDANEPFIVQTDRFHIQVLGTSFNVNTYEKDWAKTILTAGKIMVQQGGHQQVLTPGSAAICDLDGLQVVQANVEEALSWKDGYFFFDGKTLAQILQELSRWYGVSVNVQASMDQAVYQGGAKKNATLATVCQMLTDLSGRAFEIDGKTLTVK